MLESLQEPKALGSIGAIGIVLLLCGWSYLPKNRGPDIKRYQALKQIQQDLLAKRSNPAERAAMKDKAIKSGKEIADVLKKTAGSADVAQQSLLWAARDELPRMFNGSPEAQLTAEKSFADRLQEAAYLLGLEKRPAIPVVAQGAPLPDD